MRLLILLAIFIALGVSTPAANFPIKNGLLQSSLNAGGNSLTNVHAILDENGLTFIGTTNRAASQAEVNAATVTDKYLSPGVVAGSMLSVGALRIGSGNSYQDLIVTNADDVPGFGKAMSWYQTLDLNTNIIFATNGPITGRNVLYTRNNTMNLWTNNALNITNWGNPTNVIYTLQTSLGGSVVWSNISGSGLGGQWFSVTGGTNLPTFSTFFPSNSVYKYQGYGLGASNYFTMLTSTTNGNRLVLTSNGVPYTVVGAIGSTNQTTYSP